MKLSANPATFQMPVAPNVGSIGCALASAGGISVVKLGHTIDGNGAQTDNIFSVTGVVRLLHISFYVTAVVDSTTFSGVKFDLSDGAANTDITATVDCSAIVVGSYCYRENTSASALAYISAATAAVHDPAVSLLVFSPVLLAQKGDGTATYIRLNFTGDGSTNITANMCVFYEPLSSNAGVLST